MPRIIDVVEFLDNTGREIVHREPPDGPGDFRLGSQVIVRESQTAVFFRDGKSLDTFGPGRHTITTANIPILAGIIGLATMGKSPFPAEVVFVNMKEFLDQKWGTPEPIVFRDSELGMVRLRSFGVYAFQVKEPALFVNGIVGQQGIYTTAALDDFLRSMIVAKMTDLLGEQKKSVLDLPSLYNEIGAGTKAQLNDDFDRIGLTLKALYVNAITPTEDTAKAIDERAAMGAIGDMDKYLKFKAARAMGDAANNPSGVGGGAMQMGVGLGAGAGLGAGLAGMMSEAMRSQQGDAKAAATIICPNCNTSNPIGSKFCSSCGTKLSGTIKCPTCGTENPAGAKFCSNDGTKLS
ncbi:MAG: SPFH domain-containing protein [Chloroflexota bacterium]|nr:SPFH domain-containing protein [Chloroflexota bacterium]